MFRVFELHIFAKRARKKLSPPEYKTLNNIKDGLRERGYLGDVLGPYSLREIRIHNKRIYFVVEGDVVLLVDVSDKNNQQATIDEIRKELPGYLSEIRKLSGRE